MQTQQRPEEPGRQRVAIPYYGALTHPQTGLSTLFFVAQVDQRLNETAGLQLTVWDKRQYPRLADWFKAENINGLLCHEKDNPHLQELGHAGIWTIGGSTGEAEEMFSSWFDTRVKGAEMDHQVSRQVA